jgi:RNA polymerase sigma-70 factor (ECF subfamily)
MSTTIFRDADIDSWYRSYAAQLRSAARRIVGNGPDAEDAVQEAFIAAFRAIDRYDGTDPYPWLYRIATRKALTIASARRPVGMPLASAASRVRRGKHRLRAQIRATIATLPESQPA